QVGQKDDHVQSRVHPQDDEKDRRDGKARVEKDHIDPARLKVAYDLGQSPVGREKGLPKDADDDGRDDGGQVDQRLKEVAKAYQAAVDRIGEKKAQGDLAKHRNGHDVKVVFQRDPKVGILKHPQVMLEADEVDR